MRTRRVARPTGHPGFRHSIRAGPLVGFDLLWVINGVLFYVLIFSTGQWHRLVADLVGRLPERAVDRDAVPLAATPENAGYSTYNALQLLAYFVTVFVAPPLAIVAGCCKHRRWPKFGTSAGVLNRQVARSIHFGSCSGWSSSSSSTRRWCS